jgi:hypothetical protein
MTPPNRHQVPHGFAFMDRKLDDQDRYLVSFCVGYAGIEHHGCESPRDAAQSALDLVQGGFPVFVYDLKLEEVHRFEHWVMEGEEDYDEEGFAEGWYLVDQAVFDGSESYYRVDGTTVAAKDAFKRYEVLTRFTSKSDAENHAAALRLCGKVAVPRQLTYYGKGD